MTIHPVNEIMNRFKDALENPYEKLRLLKEDRETKVVGCSPMHFPEEIIHAAGMLPVVLQETDEAVTEGFSHVHSFFCGITRNMIDIGVKGHLNFFDALIYSDICIQNRNTACTLKHLLPDSYVEYAQFPTSLNREGVLEDTVRELERLKDKMGQLAGCEIDDQSLEKSIQVYNRNRSLLRRFHDLCRFNPNLLPIRDKQAVIKSSMLIPKEEHSELLESLLKDLETQASTPQEGTRLFLSGHLCQGPKADILDLIEGMGGLILDDDLYTGYRYFAVDVEMNGSPTEALARRYLDKTIPIPTLSDETIRWDQYILERVKDSGAQGVIILIAKYCEPHLFLYPFIKKSLTTAGVPHLMLETEHEVVSLEGMKTRLQAFMEMLGKGG